MRMPAIDYSIEAVQSRLRAKRSKVMVVLRGKSALNLQAVLPPKPLSGKRSWHQQYIPLRRSYPDGNSKDSLKARAQIMKVCEAEADLLNTELLYERFTWDKYAVRGLPNTTPVGEVVAKFEQAYRRDNELQDKTWARNWWRYFKLMPQDKNLTPNIMLNTVALKSTPHTGTRQTMIGKFEKLAKFAAVDVDFSPYKENLSKHRRSQQRTIPSDEIIRANRPQITTMYKKTQLGWQWVYGIIYVAGLRPHEAFFCEWSDKGLEVLKGKTGPRTILYQVMELTTPGLIDEWNLKAIELPRIDAESAYANQSLGNKISIGLSRQGVIEVNPYDLRHAFALNTIKARIPERVAANMMGHTIDIHRQRYRKWLDVDRSEEILDQMLADRGF